MLFQPGEQRIQPFQFFDGGRHSGLCPRGLDSGEVFIRQQGKRPGLQSPLDFRSAVGMELDALRLDRKSVV